MSNVRTHQAPMSVFLACLVTRPVLVHATILMSVRSQASVLTGAVRTSPALTAACAMRASSHLQTAKCAVTLMSVRTSGCVLTATASILKALSSVSATRDTSAHRKAATAKISMSVRGRQTVRGGAVSTIWAHTTVSARGATSWLEARDAKT